jgi:hypothetical protein
MDWPFDYPASVVEADTSVIYCLIRIWQSHTAIRRGTAPQKEKGANELCRPAVIGHSILEFIDGPHRDYYGGTAGFPAQPSPNSANPRVLSHLATETKLNREVAMRMARKFREGRLGRSGPTA